MMKKLSVMFVLSAALLFGGIFQTSVDAASHADQGQTYKAFYNVNGQWGQGSLDNINKYYNLFQQIQQSLKNNGWDIDVPAQPAPEKPVQPKPEEPAKPAPEKPAIPKPEQPAKPAPTTPAPSQDQNQGQQYQLNEFEQQVVQLTNNERAQAGLAPLKADWELSRVAREKSRDMATRNYFDHNSPTYGSPFDMMTAYGIHYRTAGENIAYGQRTPQEVVNAWMNSPGHRENIMNGNFTHIGVGYVESGNYWTQMFIEK